MAIYHMEAKVVSRGAGRSAVAAAAYMSCSRLYNDYDGVQHDYTRKGGLVWQQVFLPDHAPPEWQDRERLWNAVEAAEKTKDSRLAREFVVALPVELNKDVWVDLLSEFIRAQFVSDSMCADAAIHDTDGHNPHAHILLTVRPLNKDGSWQYKTEKEYLCVRDGEERGFTAAEFQQAQKQGWEKQYQYRVGRKRVYLPPSKAKLHGYERVSKYPKSTKYGRQNPITARWNSEEQLIEWRAAWAEAVNRALELARKEERIDHRSHAERGLEERPTIHEGVTARKIELAGYIADRCEINRQIRADNRLIRELKATVKKLGELVKVTLPAIAKAMETVRRNLIVLHYGLNYTIGHRRKEKQYLSQAKPKYWDYLEIRGQIKEKQAERGTLKKELEGLSVLNLLKRNELKGKIAELTEEIEELRNEEQVIIRDFGKEDSAGMKQVKSDIADSERAVRQLDSQEAKLNGEIEKSKQEFERLKEQAAEFDSDALISERLALRKRMEASARERIRQAFGEKHPHAWDYAISVNDTDGLLDEADLVERYQHRQAQKQYAKMHPKQERKPKVHKQER